MPDAALGDHGFYFAGESSLEGGHEGHGEAGGVLDHLCVDFGKKDIYMLALRFFLQALMMYL